MPFARIKTVITTITLATPLSVRKVWNN